MAMRAHGEVTRLGGLPRSRQGVVEWRRRGQGGGGGKVEEGARCGGGGKVWWSGGGGWTFEVCSMVTLLGAGQGSQST